MIQESFTIKEKFEIANQIKNITFEQVEREMDKLIVINTDACNTSARDRTGNNVVDYFTFPYRLETKGKYNTNYYDFLTNIDEFKKKKFIQTMVNYYTATKNKNNTKNKYILLKEIYNICISAINIIRPLVYMEIYAKYKPTCILDFCAGWGGAAVGCCALNIPKYIGIEINQDLKEPYDKLITYLKTKSTSQIQMIFEDALKIDYSTLKYDFVFTSPPYYFIQKYPNNESFSSKKDMNERFYKPLFLKVFDGLQPQGNFIINVCNEVYVSVLEPLFGPCLESFPYKKSKRQNNYQEMCYAWIKKV